MNSYVQLLIQTCHKRGAHAMGGMAAQIPIKNDIDANVKAMNLVKKDKLREAASGHDGTWIAHPGLADIALDAFNDVMPDSNQIDKENNNPSITQSDLLKVPNGTITENGLRHNIKVGIQYVEAWLRGNGCVPLYNLMEDAATAEISRAQLWQWIKHEVSLNTGQTITSNMVSILCDEELDKVESEIGSDRFKEGKFQLATQLFRNMILKDDFDEFLTLPAYKHI